MEPVQLHEVAVQGFDSEVFVPQLRLFPVDGCFLESVLIETPYANGARASCVALAQSF